MVAAFVLTLSAPRYPNGHPAVRDFLLGGALIESLGSNNWVVDGTLSATGKPLLANDPHLGTKLPSTWYLAHLSAGDFDVDRRDAAGHARRSRSAATVSSPGERPTLRPTSKISTGSDWTRQDDSPSSAVSQEPLTIVPETITVKGGEPVSFDVRITRHGPLVSDAINANNADRAERLGGPRPAPLAPLALRWTALDGDDTTLSAFLKVNEARNWNDFTEALRGFVVPSQNFVYGDVDGHIGYYAPGRIPMRARGDGSLPVDGWSGEAEWTGWIPFDELPHLYDPPEHFIVTANNRPAGSGYTHTLGVDWPEPFRATRITELLRGRTKLTPDDFARIQSDTVSLHARTLLPLLMQYARPADTQADRHPAEMGRGCECRKQRVRDFPGVVSSPAPGDRRRRPRPACDGQLRGTIQLRHAVSGEHAHFERREVVRRCAYRAIRNVRGQP